MDDGLVTSGGEPDAGIQKIIFAVPEPDRCAVFQREIDPMLVVC